VAGGVATAALVVALEDQVTGASRAILDRLTALRALELCAALALLLATLALLQREHPAAADRLQALVRRAARRADRAVASVPPVLVLALLVGAAAGFWLALGRAVTLPRVFGDELIYSGLAKGFALEGVPVVRGQESLDYGFAYPLLISPAYRLARDGAGAYGAVQALNAVVMALAALQSYAVARRILRARWALAVAALTVALPAMTYSALVMTESLFYPSFCLFALVLIRSLERPTRSRQAALVLTLLALFAVRPQAVTLVGAALTAVAVHGWCSGALARTLRTFLPTWIALAVTGSVVAAVALSGGHSPLGAYGVLVRGIDPLAFGRWTAWTLADVDLALGVSAFAVVPIGLVLLLRDRRAAERAVAAVAVSTFAWLLASVVVLSTSTYGLDRLHERSLSYCFPLLLTVAVWWATRSGGRRGALTVAAGLGAVVLPALLPERLLLGATESPDALGAVPWAGLATDLGLTATPVTRLAAGLAALAIVALFVARPGVAVLVPLSLTVLAGVAAADTPSQVPRDRADALAWVDRALGEGERATLVYTVATRADCRDGAARTDAEKLARSAEFFNVTVTRVVHLGRDNPATGLTSQAVALDGSGVVRLNGAPLDARHVVLDARLSVAGRRIETLDAATAALTGSGGMSAALSLWEVRQPLRIVGARPPGADGCGS